MKKNLGNRNALYPMPITVVGTQVDGRNNYIAIAHVGIIDHNTISISSGKLHYSNIGIKQNRTLSVNIISEDQVDAMNRAGSLTGAKEDKSGLFEAEYGTLEGAPMIKDAPVSMECEVIDIYDRPEFDVFICRIVNTYADESVLNGDKIDLSKVHPVLFAMMAGYWKLGDKIER